MGCMCCCFRSPPKEDGPSAQIIKKNESPKPSPRKSYGAIPTEDEPQPVKERSTSPRKSPEEILYNSPPQSSRAKSPSPKETKKRSDRVVTIKASDEPYETDERQKKTLAEIAGMAKTSTVAFRNNRRTSSPKPSEHVRHKKDANHSEHTKDDQSEDPFRKVSNYPSKESLESDTCHSIGDPTDEDEESEDSKVFRNLPRTLSPSMGSIGSVGSEGSDTQLMSKGSSPGSSTHDLSGKKHSKAKDFMKKAGKNMKKAKKKVGKGVEKMVAKKKREEERQERSDTKERADSTSANEATPSTANVKRVSSERMKSKYAREKLAAIEKKREEEANQRAEGFPDPRQAAMERGEKLSELEDKTEQMRESAASFARNASMLKSRHASSS